MSTDGNGSRQGLSGESIAKAVEVFEVAVKIRRTVHAITSLYYQPPYNSFKSNSMEEAKGLIRTIATAEDPSLVRCFRGHEKAVTSVGFSKEM
jgi:hypothetical protein